MTVTSTQLPPFPPLRFDLCQMASFRSIVLPPFS
jgi:hypothetical protein